MTIAPQTVPPTDRNPSDVAVNLAAVRVRMAAAAGRSGREASAVRLVLATKTIEPAVIREAVASGQCDLGENKVQEGRRKAEALIGLPLRWSVIGHLQSNKVKDALRFADELQSLDRLSLAAALDKRLLQLGRRLDVLVQVNTSGEASKYGLRPTEVADFLRELPAFTCLRPLGFMTLARFTSDQREVRRCFQSLCAVRKRAVQDSPGGEALRELSMGMSNDYEIAIEEGATIVRIGQAVFGPRSLPDSFYWPAAGDAE